MFVSTSASFLEDYYVTNFKLKSRMLLEEMSNARVGKSLELFGNKVVVSDAPHVTTDLILSTSIPHCSGRIIWAPNRFMFLGETYEAIQEEPESDPGPMRKRFIMWMLTTGSRLWKLSWNPCIATKFVNL